MSAATSGLESRKTIPLVAPAGKSTDGKMKFRRQANSNDNAIRAESLLKTDSWKLVGPTDIFLGADCFDLAVSVPYFRIADHLDRT
jgi:hypothetical protein